MNPSNNLKYAYFGGGCFWCIEAVFENLVGVVKVKSGYSGGVKENANYQAVASGKTKHAEICEIQFDPNSISYQTLLKVFFLAHDPTQINQQGNDIGPQYRSIIFYQNEYEKNLINTHINNLKEENIYNNIVTEIQSFDKFYPAENYHQNYYNNNSSQPYCSFVIRPKLIKLREVLKKYYVTKN